MKKISPRDVGLIVGLTACMMHIVWSLAVLLGWASWYLDFMLSLHFVSNPFVMQSFDLGKAIMLWVITFIAGYVVGWVSGVIWNMIGNKK